MFIPYIYAVRFHILTTTYGCKLALVADEPVELTEIPVVEEVVAVDTGVCMVLGPLPLSACNGVVVPL